MFEKLVESILVEYLSEWIDGLDAEKMKIALFSGKVEFRELKLKTSSLDKFQLPFKIMAGTIGRLAMKVPWKRLTKEAVKIRIEDVFVLVAPTHQEEFQRHHQQQQQQIEKSSSGSTKRSTVSGDEDDADSYVLRQRWTKQQEVRVRELFEKTKQDTDESSHHGSDGGGSEKGDTTAGWGYREKILHNILDNVSVELANIHIRYEDSTQLVTRNPFALGLTIRSIVVHTTNANGHFTFVDRSQSHTPFVHKILEMDAAGFYCDSTSSVRDLFQPIQSYELQSNLYIVHPFNTSVKMTVNHDDTTAFSIPKLQFVADISSIKASVTPGQCNDLISVISFVSTHEQYLKRLHCKKKRPTLPVKRNAKAWWQYALHGVQVMYSIRKVPGETSPYSISSSSYANLSKTRCDWKLFGSLWFSRKKYIHLHKKLLRAAAKKSAIESVIADRRCINELEDKLDVQTIVFFRLCAAQEIEMEDSRHDSVKKLANWKARWTSRSRSTEYDHAAGHRQLDPLEKLLIYTTVHEQLHASSVALAEKQLAIQNSKTILFAIDIAVTSFQISLIEQYSSNGASMTQSTGTSSKDFVQFELHQFVFAIFQRTRACQISSSIKSIQFLDFSNIHDGSCPSNQMEPQALFYSLSYPGSSEISVDSLAHGDTGMTTGESGSLLKHFLELSIDSTESKLQLHCCFEPFRYIHNLSVAAKMQTYFVAQVDVSPVLKENAEEAIAYSSVWINNAVFAQTTDIKHSGGNEKSVEANTTRAVEFSVRLPEVNVWVLASETSPVLELKLTDVHFNSGNLLDTFAFSIEGIEILFVDGLESDTVGEVSSNPIQSTCNKGPPKLQHQSAQRSISSPMKIDNGGERKRIYDIQHRNYSTILRRTRLVFLGEKHIERNCVPKWVMKCTAPPIYFTLSSAQYHQVLDSAAKWERSNFVVRNKKNDETTATSGHTKDTSMKSQVNTQHTARIIREFDPHDERFDLQVLIPQIMIVLEGGNATTGELFGTEQEPQDGDAKGMEQIVGIDLVLDIKEVTVEAKFSSSTEAIAIDIKTLLLSKRMQSREHSEHEDSGKSKTRIPTVDALALANEEAQSKSSNSTGTSNISDEPDPVYDSNTGRPTRKLLEIGPAASLLISSVEPFKGKIKAKQVALYWDQDLLVALFRSYLLGTSALNTDISSAASSRSSSSEAIGGTSTTETSHSNVGTASHGEKTLSGENNDQPAPFAIELQVERWYIFMRPHITKTPCLALRLSGTHLLGDISTLHTSFLAIKFYLNDASLESTRVVIPSEGTTEDTGTNRVGCEELCELLKVDAPVKIIVESGGYGTLPHRADAGTYVNIEGSEIKVNYVNAHYGVFANHMEREIISFINWVSVQTRPADVSTHDQRTKIDAHLTSIKLTVPRGVVGNPNEQQKKPEHLEVNVKQVTIASRAYPDYPQVEQLGIQIDAVQMSTCMMNLQCHEDTDTSVDAASSKHTMPQISIAQTRSQIFVHDGVFVEYVAVPVPGKKVKRKSKREADIQNVPKVDIEDIKKEMERICGFVKVSLIAQDSWIRNGDMNTDVPTKNKDRTGQKKQQDLTVQIHKCIELKVDHRQVELLSCILDENISHSELPLRPITSPTEDEYMVISVEVRIGDAVVFALQRNGHDGHRTRKVDAHERIVAQVDVAEALLLIKGYSSLRTQYCVHTADANLWLINQNGDDERINCAPISCAELYNSSENSESHCVDITIDQYPPPSDPETPPVSQDIRIHVDTCALTPSMIQFALRLKPFVLCEPKFAFYVKPQSKPMSLSVTTGTVYCMLTQYCPELNSNETVDGSVNPSAQSDTPLNLIIAGCIVVRYNNDKDNSDHIQLFGRKMSLEITSKWPPVVSSRLSMGPSSPCSSPTCSPISSGRWREANTVTRSSTSAFSSLADYNRILCDDYAFDVDIVDTKTADNAMKISASLTHFHAVFCVLDIYMLSKLGDISITDADFNVPTTANNECNEVRTADLVTSTNADQNTTDSVVSKVLTVINVIVEDASVTFVREIGEYFTPVARIYSFCTMCEIALETEQQPPLVSAHHELQPVHRLDIALHFSEDDSQVLGDDEGMSMWSFNPMLGTWEPILEPWTFSLGIKLVSTSNGKVTTTVDLTGSEAHSLNVNFSPSLFDSICAMMKELEQLTLTNQAIHVPTASIISCGFYLANDCGTAFSYWISDHGVSTQSSRGYSYATRQNHVSEPLLTGHKVPLKLSTAIFPSLPTDQTVSFSFGDDSWHPLTDVRIHSAGKYVYSILPKSSSRTSSSNTPNPATGSAKTSAASSKCLLALFDISTVLGYRTLTVSSLVRIFNDTDIAVDCGVLGEDGKTVTIGTINPHDACGVPITMITSIGSVRVFIKPQSTAISGETTAASSKQYRWSNELFVSEKEESTEHYVSCSLVLDDFDCKCQRMFDGSQPLHVSQICKANGSYFRVWSRIFASSNASSLKYAQLRLLPPLTFENKCGVSIYAVVFVFKKVRRAGAQDREYFHLVASEKIPPRSNTQFLASSLQENTYCSISITGFSWSKLFLLPSVFPQAGRVGAAPQQNADNRAGANDTLRNTNIPPSLPSSSSGNPTSGCEVLCSLTDFRDRTATINVAFQSAMLENNAIRKVTIQPRFVIHNDTSLQLGFQPSVKVKSTISTAKAMFSLSSSAQKQIKTCCGSTQLEMIHSKLNALHGATTTPRSPISRSSTHNSQQSNPSTEKTHEEDHEVLYCSDSSTVDIQLEGNTLATSGVQQFRLDAAITGANCSLRIFDEGKKQWYDVVAILDQLDAYTTKVTFVERYIFLNRTEHEFICAPACDILQSATIAKDTHTPALAIDKRMIITSMSTSAFNWGWRPLVPSDSCVRLKILGGSSGASNSVTGWRWSGKFSLHEVSETALKLSNKYTNQVHVIRIEVRLESSIRAHVVLTSEDSAAFPLYRIINSSTKETITFRQSFEGGSGELSEHGVVASLDFSRGVTLRLLPGESTCFGWDEAFFLHSLERVLILSYSSDAVQSSILLDQPGEARRIDFPALKSSPGYHVYVHWYLHGVTKTLHVHDTQLPRDKLTGKQTQVSAPINENLISAPITVISEMAIHLRLPNILLSIVNSKPEEILLLSAEDIDVDYAKTLSEHDQCEVKVRSLQLDNQLENAIFPVIFTPTPTNDTSFGLLESPKKAGKATTTLPGQEHMVKKSGGADRSDKGGDYFFHLSILRLSYGDDVEYIKYLSMMLQPARIQLDDFLVISIASFVTNCIEVVTRHYPPQLHRRYTTSVEMETSVGLDRSRGPSETQPPRADIGLKHRRSTGAGQPVTGTTINSTTIDQGAPPPAEHRMYIETMQLHPIKLQITFQQNALNNNAASFYWDDQATLLLPVVFLVLKSNLANIDCASLNLNALHIYHSFTTRMFMFSTVRQHYLLQGVLKMYALVGAADFLGNPIGLVTNLGTGVKDFFYEPVAGMVKSPQDFVLGLSRGTASLVKNSVAGTFNAASKFTGTLSSGIALLSMDSQYINARNTRNRQEVATHLGTGLLYGTKQLGQGILAGVSGVITAPAMGAYNNGLTGFVEGVGKGLIGVAVKPTAGILDLAAKTTAGITATATVFDRKARNTRMRLPRMIHSSDKRLRVYSQDEALISQLLHRLPRKLAQNEYYEAHVFLPANRVLIATSHQLLHVDCNGTTSATAVATGMVTMAPITFNQPQITWKYPHASVWGAQKTARGVHIFIGTATVLDVPTITAQANTNSAASTTNLLLTKSSMTTVLIPLRHDTEANAVDKVLKCISDLVARERERNPSASTSASAAPPPRNSIGLVLEPVRDNAQVQGYRGFGGRVLEVLVGSACFRAGVQVGDVIIGFGGKELSPGDHGSELRTQLSLMKKGDILELMVLRHGQVQTIHVAAE